VLITGGATGSDARRALICPAGPVLLLAAGVRTPSTLTRAKHPSYARTPDLADPAQREALVRWSRRHRAGPRHRIVNAIQRRVRLARPEPWARTGAELAINLARPSPAHSCAASTRVNSPIVNVTSGLAFVPLAGVPIYCATKAAMLPSRCRCATSSRVRACACGSSMPPAATPTSGPDRRTQVRVPLARARRRHLPALAFPASPGWLMASRQAAARSWGRKSFAIFARTRRVGSVRAAIAPRHATGNSSHAGNGNCASP
jgi:uncharacterized oxidoreductase